LDISFHGFYAREKNNNWIGSGLVESGNFMVKMAIAFAVFSNVSLEFPFLLK